MFEIACICKTPGESLESEPEPTEPALINVQQKHIEVENEKFLIRMDGRIKQWKKANGVASLPIYKDEQGLYWWANREQRKAIGKRRRKVQGRA